MLNFVKGFFSIYEDDHMVFIFQFVNMVYHIDWFLYIEDVIKNLPPPKKTQDQMISQNYIKRLEKS